MRLVAMRATPSVWLRRAATCLELGLGLGVGVGLGLGLGSVWLELGSVWLRRAATCCRPGR